MTRRRWTRLGTGAIRRPRPSALASAGAAAALVLVFVVGAGELPAQGPTSAPPDTLGHLVGSVRDATTGAPVPLADVTLPELGRGTVTDSAGRFDLAFVPARTHRLVIRHIRYGIRDAEVTVQAGEAVGAEIELDPEAIRLEPLQVTVRRLNSDLLGTGFYRRKYGGADGFFADEEYLNFPVREGLLLDAALGTMRQAVLRLGIRPGGRAESGRCRVTMLDGRLYRGYEPIYAGDLAGIEVYRRHEIPLEARFVVPPDRLANECDLVLLWSDRDGATPGEDSLRAIGGGR